MSVFFTEDRTLPKQFRVDGYGDATFTEAGGAAIMKAVSPWDFLTGVFVTKPAQEHAAQVAIAQTQAQTALAMQQEADFQKKGMVRNLMFAGAGLAGLLVIAMVLRPAPRAVAGYRKRRSKRSRR